MSSSTSLVDAVKRMVALLVARDYSAAERISQGVRLNASEIEGAVQDYGHVLVAPPDSAFDSLDAIEVRGSNPKRWSVRFDLWTADEGRSDLTLELTVEETDPPKIELDDLHVL